MGYLSLQNAGWQNLHHMADFPPCRVALPQEVVECPAGANLLLLLAQVCLCVPLLWLKTKVNIFMYIFTIFFRILLVFTLLYIKFSLQVIMLNATLSTANGTAGSQLSTPRSGKSPSPSPTSPASLRRRQVTQSDV